MFAETKTTGQALQVNHPAHEKQDKKRGKRPLSSLVIPTGFKPVTF